MGSFTSYLTAKGCSLHPNCLECPEPDCMADKIIPVLRAKRRVEIKELREQGLTTTEIAERFKLSQRQVYRYLK